MPAPAPITIMATSSSELAAGLRLLAWLSPGLPTGAFAYSHGLEWAVEAGDITDESTLRSWLEDVLAFGVGRTDAILLRHSWRAGAVLAGRESEAVESLADLAALAIAALPCRERREESLGQGRAFAAAAAAWRNTAAGATLLPPDLPYPVALGALAGMHKVAEEWTAAGFLQAFAANLISVAVRLVPLGQSAGLRVLSSLEPAIRAVAADTAGAPLSEIGGAAFRSEIAAMRHETQRVRLFRT
jgi:urease accessory protein